MFVVIETQVRLMSIKQLPLEKKRFNFKLIPFILYFYEKIVNKDLYEIDS